MKDTFSAGRPAGAERRTDSSAVKYAPARACNAASEGGVSGRAATDHALKREAERGPPNKRAYHRSSAGRPARQLGTVDQRGRRRVSDQSGHPTTGYQSGPIRYKRQTLSRPHDGKYGIGIHETYRRIHMNAPRQDRYMGSSAAGEKEIRKDNTSTTNSMDMSRLIGNQEKGCTSGCRRSGYSDIRPGPKRRGPGLDARLCAGAATWDGRSLRIYGPKRKDTNRR